MIILPYAASSVGVAMGSGGSAMAVKTADVVLMSDNLTKLPAVIAIGRMARDIIFQNVCFSIVIKLGAILLATVGYIRLWHAIFIDVGTLLVVIANGTRPLYTTVFLNLNLNDCKHLNYFCLDIFGLF